MIKGLPTVRRPAPVKFVLGGVWYVHEAESDPRYAADRRDPQPDRWVSKPFGKQEKKKNTTLNLEVYHMNIKKNLIKGMTEYGKMLSVMGIL